MSGGPMMDALLTDGGIIRKLWLGETKSYRDHLLRLDPESRHNRFGGGVADELIAAYAARALRMDAVLPGFLIEGVLRGVAELKPFGAAFPTEAEGAFTL